MGNYYASRGWVYVSIDYRTTEELGDVDGKSQEEMVDYYRGIAPQAWIEHALENVESSKQLQQSVAMYAAQRDQSRAAMGRRQRGHLQHRRRSNRGRWRFSRLDHDHRAGHQRCRRFP